MPFVPKYDARFIGPVRDNVLALFEDQELEALQWANSGKSMTKTAIWRRSWWYNTRFPVVSVVSKRTRPDEAADQSRIESTHDIDVEVEIEGKNPDDNVLEVEKRIAAYDMILRSATKADILAGLTTTKSGGLRITIGDHDYSYFGTEGDNPIYRAVASFTVSITLIELARRPQT